MARGGIFLSVFLDCLPGLRAVDPIDLSLVESELVKLLLSLSDRAGTVSHLAWADLNPGVHREIKALACFFRAEDLSPIAVSEDRHVTTGTQLERTRAGAQMIELDGTWYSERFEPSGIYEIAHGNAVDCKLLAFHSIRHLIGVPGLPVRPDRSQLYAGIDEHLC